MDESLLRLQAGLSFRASCLNASENLRGHGGQKIRYIVETVVFSQHKISLFNDQILGEFAKTLQKIDELNHLSIEKMLSYREKLRMYDDFRRKSGHALLQTRLQAVIMTVMYIAVFAYVWSRFGFKGNETYIVGSLILYFAGFIYLLRLGKSYKWKI